MTPETIQMPVLGAKGESCGECGAELATDQRYCLNCGRRRAGPRIASVPEYLMATGAGGAGTPEPPSRAAAPAPRPQLSPLMTATAVAALGVFLLIGVLIGRGDSDPPQAAAPAVVKVGDAGGGSADTAATTTPTNSAKNARQTKKANGGEVSGKEVSSLQGAGTSGETVKASKGALEELENTTGEAYQEAQKKLPDKIATPGKLPPQDPGGESGAGTQATVIK